MVSAAETRGGQDWLPLLREAGVMSRRHALFRILWDEPVCWGTGCCKRDQYGGNLVAKLCPTLATPKNIAHQTLLSMEYSRHEYWSGLPFPSPGIFSIQGLNPGLLHGQVDSLPTEHHVTLWWPVWTSTMRFTTTDKSLVFTNSGAWGNLCVDEHDTGDADNLTCQKVRMMMVMLSPERWEQRSQVSRVFWWICVRRTQKLPSLTFPYSVDMRTVPSQPATSSD